VSDPLLTLDEVARELRCSVRTVKRRVHGGELAAVVDGRLVRVRESDLRRYVLERLGTRTARVAVAVPAGREVPRGAKLWD
jgi:excisionase family DNA binding protein